MKTWNATPQDVEQKWWLVDATDKTLGRMSTEIAGLLRGKHKPMFTPHVDTGDFVIVINSDKIKLSGNKLLQKKYYSHSRHFGSTKDATAKELLQKDSPEMFRLAVEGMLPNNKLARTILNKLKVYPGSEHPHDSQKPEAYSIDA